MGRRNRRADYRPPGRTERRQRDEGPSVGKLHQLASDRRELDRRRLELTESIEREVDRLRAEGVSWRRLSKVVGVSDQALQQGWARRSHVSPVTSSVTEP